MAADHSFVLLHAHPDAAPTSERALRALSVPVPPSYLVAGSRRQPRLTQARPRDGSRIVVEPITIHNQRFLLLLVGAGGDVHHNGQPVGPVTLLRVRDEVHTGGHRFFVSVQRASGLSEPQSHHLGTTCPFCRLAIEAGTRVFECACGTLLHCEDERWPEESRLACAEPTSSCPNCKQPIIFEAGLEWEPAL